MVHGDTNHCHFPIHNGRFLSFVKNAALLKKYPYQLNKCYFGYYISTIFAPSKPTIILNVCENTVKQSEILITK